MTKCVIYIQDDGIPALLTPTEEGLNTYSILEIAKKDVPVGKPFKIIDAEDLPQDLPQEDWHFSEDDLTDGVGGKS